VTSALTLDLAYNSSNLVNDVSLYWNRTLASSMHIPTDKLDLGSGVFHHARLQLENSNGGVYATATLVPTSLGIPGGPINIFSNLFIAGALLGDSRLEFAGRNNALAAKVDLENILAEASTLAPLLLSPGESIVVVHNLAAFVSRYGMGIRVAGEFSGSLNNTGDRLILEGPLGEPILDFSYDPSWYPETDGNGFSLVTVNPLAPINYWESPSNWRASPQTGGSPGTVDPFSVPVSLAISVSIAGDLISMSWPDTSDAYGLYSKPSLAVGTPWVAVTNTPTVSGYNRVVTLPFTNETSFFRLQAK
jgi:hypothetical protein